jgi:hypothetical protein
MRLGSFFSMANSLLCADYPLQGLHLSDDAIMVSLASRVKQSSIAHRS